MYLSYSGYKSVSSCPQMYWHQYVGKTRLEVPDNRVNSLFGTIVGGLFEAFYRDRLWREKGIEQILLDRVPGQYARAVAKETRDGAIRWKPQDPKANYESPEALLADVRTAIPRGLSIIRHHRLLGPTQSEAEVKLDLFVGGHTIGGRADFIIKRIAPHHDLVLLDGKGSKWRDKYVDPRQLKWYAMLHWLKYNFPPDKIGFVFWRFEPVEALDWVPFTEGDLLGMQDSVQKYTAQIEDAITRLAALDEAEMVAGLKALFPASPGDRCQLCAFRPICPEGSNFAQIRVPLPDGLGVEDVGF